MYFIKNRCLSHNMSTPENTPENTPKNTEEYTTIHGETVAITMKNTGGFPSIEGMIMAKMMSHQTTLRFGDAWKNEVDELNREEGCKIVKMGDMVYTFAPKP